MAVQTKEISALGLAALEYAARGWPVFPLVPGGKLPAISVDEGGAGQHDATTVKAQIVAWWERFPNANIGVNLKEAGLVVVDADTYKPECEWVNQVAGRDIPETLRQISASGGMHYFFTAQSQEEFPRNFCKGVDIKRNGYVLLEPSVFMGRKYRFETDDDIVPCPAWIPRKPPAVKRPASARKDLQPTDRETWAILDWIDPDANGYHGWVDILFAIHDRYEGSDEGFKIAEEWSSRGSKFEDSDIERRWNGIKVGQGVTWASACKVAQDAGADLSQIASEFSAEAQTFALLGKIIDKARRTSADSSAPIDPGWENLLVKTSKGFVIPNVTNILTVITHHPEWRDCFAFDTFTETRILTQPIPGTRLPKSTFRGREMRDTDYVDAQVWFQRNGLPMITKNVVIDAIDTAFEASTFNALQNFFDALPPWSPETHPRKIGSWLFDYCGVAHTTDERNLYVKEVGARWLISAVARAIRPGCKADCVLILEGRQGAGKSTALAALAGEWFGDSLPPISHKDAKDYVRGKWIIEMAELANMNKAEVEEIKAFISRQHEAFRPAYARLERKYQRQCVFAGSTNKTDYLRDETGNRRFWPVQTGDSIDVAGLRRDRDLLWAEALYCFRHGSIWWLSDAVTSLAQAEQAERLNEDPWVSAISAFVAAKAETSTAEVAKSALFIETGKVNRGDSNRIAAVLLGCGFVRAGRVMSGDFKFAVRFERPEK